MGVQVHAGHPFHQTGALDMQVMKSALRSAPSVEYLAGTRTYLIRVEKEVSPRLPQGTCRERMYDLVAGGKHSHAALVRRDYPAWPITSEEHPRIHLARRRRSHEGQKQVRYALLLG